MVPHHHPLQAGATTWNAEDGRRFFMLLAAETRAWEEVGTLSSVHGSTADPRSCLHAHQLGGPYRYPVDLGWRGANTRIVTLSIAEMLLFQGDQSIAETPSAGTLRWRQKMLIPTLASTLQVA